MGCVSSKILRKSSSFREELSLSLQRRTNGLPMLEDLFTTTKSSSRGGGGNGDNMLALLDKLRSVAPIAPQEGKGEEGEGDAGLTPSPECVDDPETINAWELMADLEEQEQEQEQEEEERPEEAGSRRKAMARKLSKLRVSSDFEFSKTGSLREWIEMGGQVFSPGAYATPKFGETVSSKKSDSRDYDDAFHPELIEAFEEAMEQLSTEEEWILERIVGGLEEVDEQHEGESLGDSQVGETSVLSST